MNLPQVPCARRSGEEVARERILSSFEPIWDSSIKTCKAHWDNLRPNRETGSQDLRTRFVGPYTPEIDAAWSEYDESRLMDAWAASSIKIAFEVISPENTELQKLWRASCRLMKCSPLAIISPRFGLIYDSPGRGQLWPPEFCEALRALVCHSSWRGNALSLSTFIQYAVVCRIDDRQPWHMAMNKSSCQDIEAMRSLAACIRQEHIHDVCTTYREFQVARGCHCSLDFDMLYHLGSLVPKPPPGRTQAS
ncbi:hypothetical protein AAL_08094 [Moelleriella libera RCEF 2490]|uniref:Uncharacterized protein n=1 Tax=Moelleriella libera RCEF 2490 TaxID=1081109 RepID=A0A167W2N3_9HYPO|nr:hypothetical protein AAL_08094 [Moelleriella libera RCEF 2490]